MFVFLCKSRGQSKYKCLSVHQSVFHTVVCRQNFNLAIFQTVGGKTFLFMAIVIIVTSYFQFYSHVGAFWCYTSFIIHVLKFVPSTSRVQQGDISRPIVFYAEYDRRIHPSLH